MKEKTLEKLKKQTIIASTASSMRLSGMNITNKQVEDIIEKTKAKRNIPKK